MLFHGRPRFSLTLEEVEAMLDDFVRTEGTPEVVQFSGGEPTIHPQIDDFVKAAKARGIRFVMINTNGRCIAHDDRFVAQLAEVRPSFYFQFDGFDRNTGLTLRGEANIVEEKIRALDRLAAVGLSVTIVPAIERGVNEHEIGRIVDFAIAHPAIRGINFQPAFHVGRHLQHDPMRRITIPDILELITAQTAGRFIVSDFIPVPCCIATCNSVTYAFVEGDRVVPLPRIVNVYEYLDYLTSPTEPSPTSASKSEEHSRGCGPRRWSPGHRNRSRSSRCRAGLRDPLRDALQPLGPKIAAAFVDGSVASQRDTESDIDVLIISDELTYGEIFQALESASRILGRRVNPTVYTSQISSRGCIVVTHSSRGCCNDQDSG